MWWENFSPSYLNEVNKDEFSSVCVCIILCVLFRKHYYLDVDMFLFALSLWAQLRRWQRRRWQTNAKNHTHTASERRNEQEATNTRNEDSLLDSVQFNSVRFVPIMFVYILIIIVIVVCILYAVRSLNYIRMLCYLCTVQETNTDTDTHTHPQAHSVAMSHRKNRL